MDRILTSWKTFASYFGGWTPQGDESLLYKSLPPPVVGYALSFLDPRNLGNFEQASRQSRLIAADCQAPNPGDRDY
jgi:hypothetical protein